MGLQDQASKNCKKWLQPYKEQAGNLDKCLSPYLNTIYQRRAKYPMKHPHVFIKSESECKTAFDHWDFYHDF